MSVVGLSITLSISTSLSHSLSARPVALLLSSTPECAFVLDSAESQHSNAAPSGNRMPSLGGNPHTTATVDVHP